MAIVITEIDVHYRIQYSAKGENDWFNTSEYYATLEAAKQKLTSKWLTETPSRTLFDYRIGKFITTEEIVYVHE